MLVSIICFYNFVLEVNGWLVAPELYRYKISSGDVLYAMVFRPHNYKPGVAYPTVLNVYGGPAVQTVSNTFKVCIYIYVYINYR